MHRSAEQAQRAIYRRMSVEAKLLAAESLRDFAWELKRAVIQRLNPDLSESEVLGQVQASFRDGAT